MASSFNYKAGQKDWRICVAARRRPLNQLSLAKRDDETITIPDQDQCVVHVRKAIADLTNYLDNETFE